MLPDYIDTKNRLQEALVRWLRLRVRYYLGPLGDIPRYSIFEGKKTSIIRPNNQEDITEMHRLENEFSIKFDEVPNITLEEILKRLDTVAQKMADEMARQVYTTISDAADRVGNVIRNTGKITPEAFLEMFETIDVVFNEDGEAEMPDIHIHPSMKETLKDAIKKLHEEKKYQQKFEEIMLAKKDKWRVREADRKLVG